MGSMWFVGARQGWCLRRLGWCLARLGWCLARQDWCRAQQGWYPVWPGLYPLWQGLWQLAEHRSRSSSLADLALGLDLETLSAMNVRRKEGLKRYVPSPI